MPSASAEVIVVGAGAAGLTAAAELVRAGMPVLVLEARERIGGRCWTRRLPGLPLAVELGAEFIHGRPPATHALLKDAKLGFVDSARAQRYAAGGRLRPVDAFAQAQKAMLDRGALQERDLCFDAFLAVQKGLPPLTRTFARLMVEGFDAADPSRASARAIADEWRGASMGGAQPRPRGGYGAALDWLAGEAIEKGARLRLGAVVREVRRARRGVEVRGTFLGRPFAHFARHVIVSLPLGVLQSGAVRFRPGLPTKRRALAGLASGPVIKAALRFREPFWERRAPKVAFFHAPGAPFPTFWTPLPARAPVLIAWAGGPKAARLAGRSSGTLARTALASLGTIFGRIEEPDAVVLHDWQSDPCARGAYSYVLVGGEGARRALAQPVGNLHFAGEATDCEGESGTVAGALQSGRRAAREILGS